MKTFLINLILFFISSTFCCASESIITKQNLNTSSQRLQEAETAVISSIQLKKDNKDYTLELKKAERRYLNHVYDGYYNWATCYNLGTIYYNLKDIGHSILWLRRAEILNPAQEDIHHNLQLALQARTDLFTQVSTPGLTKLYATTCSIISPQTLFIITLISTCLLPIFLFSLRYKKQICHFLLFINILILCSTLSIIALEICNNNINQQGVILNNQINGYRGPGNFYSKAFTTPIHAGTEITILENQKGWSKVRFSNNNVAWISNDDFDFFKINTPKK